MYVQVKSACGIKYVYVVESFRKSNGSISHRIVKSMGRYDDLIKDDPEALNKLKEDVKSCSTELRNKKVVDNIRTVQALSRSQMDDDCDFTAGFPRLNYANYVLRSIWRDIICLDYRISYLQKRYHKHITDASLADLLFNRVLETLVHFEETGKIWGVELALIADNYDPQQDLDVYNRYRRDLYLEINSIYNFLYKRIDEREESHHLAAHINTEFVFDNERENPDHNGFDIDSISDEIVDKNLSRLIENLRHIFMLIINCKLSQIGKQIAEADILRAFLEAELIVEFSFGTPSCFVYTKANNGRYARVLNLIMQALDLKPLLNAQDRVELSKRFRAKFTDDSKVIPHKIYELLVNIEKPAILKS
ncbi:Uncharacterised protein [Anaerobiospirillum thomasii]|uniref:hypothetical protein n=1 Tax=Anaerobiospirillum thomasii TaxID=179995 RepID=UPI000D8AEE2E|nr:hypothetical protein [Anaerobiospirillum thomasii]SPT67991.1 Uncharacterised protein [Anaerobiospirillum thomasii]